ncbi:hypothetical protein BDR07DRAFT_1488682 [Suillus spraguei]|nr:hypothetical protein BDR07DRAFT_1488682 [Suillus spraguei]
MFVTLLFVPATQNGDTLQSSAPQRTHPICSPVFSPLAPDSSDLPVHSYIEPVLEGEEDEEMDLAPAREEDRHVGLLHEDIAAAIAFCEKSLKECDCTSYDRANDTPEELCDKCTPLLKLPQLPRVERTVLINPLVPSSALDERLRERLQAHTNALPCAQDGEVQEAVGLDKENIREDECLLVRDWTAPSGKRIAVPVCIEPKVYFANEHTFLVKLFLLDC